MELAAILISPGEASGTLRDVMERLRGVGVGVTIVDELAIAVDVWRRHRQPPAILLDLRELGAGEVEDQRLASEAIRRTLARLPNASPIVVTSDADPMMIVACVRAGAGDVLDLQLEGTAAARASVQRICERQATRVSEIAMVASQRDMIEDLLKELIRTERRAIDAEEAAARTRAGGGASTLDGRSPSVLLVESERAIADELAHRLEDAGVATFAYVTGEEALREAEALSRSSGLDLALVATRLPGIDGFETIRRLRASMPELPAFLVTSAQDVGVSTADLEVAGVVQKPLIDIDALVERLSQLARESLHRSREHVYLQRIKERHERILARYRSLPREP